jgi:hypothetical protein
MLTDIVTGNVISHPTYIILPSLRRIKFCRNEKASPSRTGLLALVICGNGGGAVQALLFCFGGRLLVVGTGAFRFAIAAETQHQAILDG